MENKNNKNKNSKNDKNDKNKEIKVKILDTIYFNDGINLFIIIKPIYYNKLNLIYTNKNFSIISYNLIDKQIINEIKNAHNNGIIDIRYYQDISNKRDLLISLAKYEEQIKIWNF